MNIEDMMNSLLDDTVASFEKEKEKIKGHRHDALKGPPTLCPACGKLFTGRKRRGFNVGPVVHCSVECAAWCALYEYEQTGCFHKSYFFRNPVHNALYTYHVISWIFLEAEKPLFRRVINRRSRSLGGMRNETLAITDRLCEHGYLEGEDRRIGGKNHFSLTEKGRRVFSATASQEGRYIASCLMDLPEEMTLRMIEMGYSIKTIRKMGLYFYRHTSKINLAAHGMHGMLKREEGKRYALTQKAKERLRRRDEIWHFLKKNDSNPSGLTFPL